MSVRPHNWQTNLLRGAESLRSRHILTAQGIPRTLLNLTVHYRIYKSPSPVSILSQINPVYAPTPLKNSFEYYPLI
jgi:hypothetical protein